MWLGNSNDLELSCTSFAYWRQINARISAQLIAHTLITKKKTEILIHYVLCTATRHYGKYGMMKHVLIS